MATMFGGQPERRLSSEPGTADLHRLTQEHSHGRYGRTLDHLIQGEIIPRLLIAHPAPAAANGLAETVRLNPTEVQEFAPLPLTLEADELLSLVDGFLARGVAVESIFVDLLAPSARRLGQFWEDDVCDFVDVTMGLWRLQEVMRQVALRVPAVTQAYYEPRSALFSSLPGEQHSFGVLMVEETFARAGWRSEALIEPRRQDLLRACAEQSFDLLGLTVSCDCPSATISDLIMAIRGVSRNPAIQVFIGGRAVNADPGLAVRAGADGTAPDARAALALAERKVPGLRSLDVASP